jgi:hypothetical protein
VPVALTCRRKHPVPQDCICIGGDQHMEVRWGANHLIPGAVKFEIKATKGLVQQERSISSLEKIHLWGLAFLLEAWWVRR